MANQQAAKAAIDMSRTKALKLQFPVEYRGASIDTLTVRRPKGRDMRNLPALNSNRLEDMFPFWANLCEVEEPLLDELDMIDINALDRLVTSFLGPSKGPRAGA